MNKTRNARDGLLANELEDFNALEDAVKEAILAKDEKIRKAATRELHYESGLCINRGFVENGKIFLELHCSSGRDNIFYICDMPAEYDGVKSPKAYGFDTRDI